MRHDVKPQLSKWDGNNEWEHSWFTCWNEQSDLLWWDQQHCSWCWRRCEKGREQKLSSGPHNHNLYNFLADSTLCFSAENKTDPMIRLSMIVLFPDPLPGGGPARDWATIGKKQAQFSNASLCYMMPTRWKMQATGPRCVVWPIVLARNSSTWPGLEGCLRRILPKPALVAPNGCCRPVCDQDLFDDNAWGKQIHCRHRRMG